MFYQVSVYPTLLICLKEMDMVHILPNIAYESSNLLTVKLSLNEASFCPGTTGNILTIPLEAHGGQDSLYLPETTNGNYSSKFGYQFIRAQLMSEEASSSLDPTCGKHYGQFQLCRGARCHGGQFFAKCR